MSKEKITLLAVFGMDTNSTVSYSEPFKGPIEININSVIKSRGLKDVYYEVLFYDDFSKEGSFEELADYVKSFDNDKEYSIRAISVYNSGYVGSGVVKFLYNIYL